MKTIKTKNWEHYLAGSLGGMIGQTLLTVLTKFYYPIEFCYLFVGVIFGCLIGLLVDRGIQKSSQFEKSFLSIIAAAILGAIVSIGVSYTPLIVISQFISLPLHLMGIFLCIFPSLLIYNITKVIVELFGNFSKLAIKIISFIPMALLSIVLSYITDYFDNSLLHDTWIFDMAGKLLPILWIMISWFIWEIPKKSRIITKIFAILFVMGVINTIYTLWKGLFLLGF